MKKFLTMVFVVAMVLTLCSFAASAEEIVDVQVNGVEVAFDVPAQVINDRTLVPLRSIFEVLGAEVNWDEETETVTAYRGNTSISLQIGSTSLFVNRVEKVIDVPAQLVNDRTLVPARAIAESFGATVDWDEANQLVIITDSTAPDFKAMLDNMEKVDNSNLEANFAMNFAMSDEEEAINFKADGNVKMMSEPLAAEYAFNIEAEGMEIPLTMYMLQEEEQLAVYMVVEMNGEKMAMKMAAPVTAIPETKVDPELTKEVLGDYTDYIKVVAQEKVNDKDTVKFVMTITDELLGKAIEFADAQGMYEGLEVDMTELVFPDMALDVYVWLDKETSADVKCYMDLAPFIKDIISSELAEDELTVSFDAVEVTMDIIGRDTVEEIVVPEDVKEIAVDMTESMEIE